MDTMLKNSEKEEAGVDLMTRITRTVAEPRTKRPTAKTLTMTRFCDGKRLTTKRAESKLRMDVDLRK